MLLVFIGSAGLAEGTIHAVGLCTGCRGDSGPDDVDESIDCRCGCVASRGEGVNAIAGQFLGRNVLSYRTCFGCVSHQGGDQVEELPLQFANLGAAVQHRQLVTAVAAVLPTDVGVPFQYGLQTSNRIGHPLLDPF